MLLLPMRRLGAPTLMLWWLSSAAGLYSADNPHILHVRDFTHISSSGGYHAVEFFAGWCGHCQRFAPTWREAAAQACSARPQLSFGVVDCVEDYLLCQEMHVDGFPTVRVFGPQLPALGQAPSVCAHGCESELQLAEALIAVLPPKTLEATTSAELFEASQNLKCAEKGSAVVAKKPPIKASSKAVSLLPVPLQDVTSAVVYGLQRELLRLPLVSAGANATAADPRLELLMAERRGAFDEWLSALAQLMPGVRNRAAMAALSSRAAEHAQINLQTWSDVLWAADSPLLPDGAAPGGIAWHGCRGSGATRGYPCGLWMLFHSMVARATDASAALHALAAIRGYVLHFFGCRDCSDHFLKLVNDASDLMPLAAESAPSPDQAQLWLWRAHNRVNQRLNATGGSAEFVGEPKLQWPTARMCPECRDANGRSPRKPPDRPTRPPHPTAPPDRPTRPYHPTVPPDRTTPHPT